MEALEGSYYLEDEEGDMSGLRGDQEAIQHLIIDRINEKNREILEDITLKDLVEDLRGIRFRRGNVLHLMKMVKQISRQRKFLQDDGGSENGRRI